MLKSADLSACERILSLSFSFRFDFGAFPLSPTEGEVLRFRFRIVFTSRRTGGEAPLIPPGASRGEVPGEGPGGGSQGRVLGRRSQGGGLVSRKELQGSWVRLWASWSRLGTSWSRLGAVEWLGGGWTVVQERFN